MTTTSLAQQYRLKLRSQPRKTDRRDYSRELYALMAALAVSLDSIARQIASKEMMAFTGYLQAGHVLLYFHTAASNLGWQLAMQNIGRAYMVRNQVFIASQVTQEQQRFLKGFVNDSAAGRYDPEREGGEGSAARRLRAQLYANRLVGTANRAWLEALPAAVQEVRWVLGENENHCPDCPREAAKGYRHPSQFSQVPGDGSTKCIVNCKCVLETKDGKRSFQLP